MISNIKNAKIVNMDEKLKHIRDEFLKSIQKVDRHASVLLIERYAAKNGYHEAVENILEPVLHTVGELWLKGTVSLAVGYTAGKIAEDILFNARNNLTKQQTFKGTIILGNIEDDFHPLGRRLVSVFLQTEGWRVVDIGNDVLAEEFVDMALKESASIIGVSAMMYSTALNIVKVRQELKRRNLENKIKLAAGGAIFNFRPELAKEVGADGTARNALEADVLMERLQKEVSCEWSSTA